MNYRLSCMADRVKGLCGYAIESKGVELEREVFSFTGTNIKENALKTIYKGLKKIKKYMSHEDIMVIEVQNVHLAEWISGLVEYKGYQELLENVFYELESIDCRYRVLFERNPYAKTILVDENKTKLNVSSVSDVMKGLE